MSTTVTYPSPELLCSELSIAPLTETREADRERMAEIVVEMCRQYGITCEMEHMYLGNPRAIVVHILSRNGLRLNLDFDGNSTQPDVFILSWHYHTWKDGQDKIISPAFCPDINQCHFHKATDVCRGIRELVRVLHQRFAMMRDGTDMEPKPKNL